MRRISKNPVHLSKSGVLFLCRITVSEAQKCFSRTYLAGIYKNPFPDSHKGH
jgi:hypothetical protein